MQGHKPKQMKLKPSLGAFFAVKPGIGSDHGTRG